MFGRLTLPTLSAEYHPHPIPNHVDPDNPPPPPRISVDQVIWFDKTHIQQEGDRVSRSGVQIHFPQDTNGAFFPLLDEDHVVEYADEQMKAVFKYAQEVRYCLGVCV